MKTQTKKDFFFLNTTKFNINKVSNLWRKSGIRFVKFAKKPLIRTLNLSELQPSFCGVFLELPLTALKLDRALIQKKLNVSEITGEPFYNSLFLITFNFYIKNNQYFNFSTKKITNLLYLIKKNNNLIFEYSLPNKLKFYRTNNGKNKIVTVKNPLIVQVSWNRNFENLKNSLNSDKFFSKFNSKQAYCCSSNKKKFKPNFNKQFIKQFLSKYIIKYIDKNIFYLLNVDQYFNLKYQFYKVYNKFYKIPKKNLYDTIWFQPFERSNQNTYLLQRAVNFPSQWIQKGDLLADCSASNKGEIALGKNLLVAYMPWEGFNFEDAVLINEKILSQYTSLHIAKYELELSETALEKITSNIPGFSNQELQNLDKKGIIKIGSWVQEGDILVGKIISTVPQTLLTHEKLLYDIMGQKTPQIEEKCLRVPLGVSGRIIRVSYVYSKRESYTNTKQKVKRKTLRSTAARTQPRSSVLLPRAARAVSRLTVSRLSKPAYESAACKHSQKLLKEIMPNNSNKISPKISKSALKKISIYIMEKREFQVGDKISGRHGNKGIISKVFSNYDMPYLSDGSSLEVILNPLGVPSRMNVGQILECLLGFAGKIFHTKFQVLCFDEIYGYEASRSYVYSKLLTACKQTKQKWIFSKKNPGKLLLFDGRNGEIFHQPVMVGVTYLMKLIHIVDEKIHARATGPYSLITQQPLRGRAKHGGQRIGEMEVWALQGFGCAYTLQELLTVKSDDLQGRKQIMQALLKNTPLKFGTPESFRVVLRELQCLCLDLQISI